MDRSGYKCEELIQWCQCKGSVRSVRAPSFKGVSLLFSPLKTKGILALQGYDPIFCNTKHPRHCQCATLAGGVSDDVTSDPSRAQTNAQTKPTFQISLCY